MFSTAGKSSLYAVWFLTVTMSIKNLFKFEDDCVFQSLGTFTPQQAMCSQGKLREDGRRRPDKQEQGERGPKTWSRRVAEHLARKTSLSQKSEVSTEDSAIEDNDSLPDLEDDLPDLSALCTVTQSTYTCHETSLPKRKLVDSLRQKHHKERHFLDTFEPSPKYRKLSEKVYSPQGELCENEHVSENPQSCQSKRRRDRISQELQAGSAPVDQEKYKIFTFPVDSTSKASTETRRQAAEVEARHIKAKFAGVRFMQDLTAFPFGTDRLCSDFVNLQTSCLDDLSDDLTDVSNFSNCMDLLEDFCSTRKPQVVIIDKIIKNGFFSAVDEKMLTRTYHVVLKVWQRFPDLIRIDVPSVLVAGDVLQKHLQNNDPTAESASSLLSGLRRDRPGLRQARLYFQLFVKGLQLSLGQCTLADQKSVNKCLAFTCLSSEGSKTLIKQVTHWLEFCLVVRQPELVPVAKVWMCELHSLLGACVLVSRDRQEAAKRLAPELKRTYKYLTDLNAKKLLLQSFSCPLLCFYVLRLVMEDQCESTIVSSQFPASIHEVVNNYYFALPPQDHLTPPPSPSDDGRDNGRGHFRMFSVQSCEELAMLVYFISKSYITCKQSKLVWQLTLDIVGEEERLLLVFYALLSVRYFHFFSHVL